MNTSEFEKDRSYFHSLFPALGARIQNLVLLEVGKVSYPKSFLFDEYPDALTLDRMARVIQSNIDQELENESTPPVHPEPFWLTLFIKALLFDEIMQLRHPRP